MTQINEMNRLIQQIKVMQSQSKGMTDPETIKTQFSFPSLLKSAIDQVNDAQMTSGHLKTQFEKGVPNVSLSDVMIANQKAGIAFDAALQIRNKLVEAYKDVMNMPL